VPRSFAIKNFGCRATQSDGAAIAADLSARGLHAVSTRDKADVFVVNTCTVTSEADRDARQEIRRLHREHPAAEILVTGCYAQRKPEELASLDGVKWVVGNSHKPAIGDVIAPQLVQIKGLERPGGFAYHGQIAGGGSLVGEIGEQTRLMTQPVFDGDIDRSRPNVKVQDGCNNRCTFCIIPSVRGRSRSATADDVVGQVSALSPTYPEVVLTGINLGRWGRDLDGRPRFTSLLRRLLDETPIRKLRISSVEPMDWTSELLELVARSPRIAKHMHIPLQSASDDVLKKMRRRYRARHYAERLNLARELMPHAAIGADVMVGFPGETAADFTHTRDFIEQMPFTYLHVFTYSMREGTEAAAHTEQVPKTIKKERNRILRELISRKNRTFRERLVGQTVSAVSLSSHGSASRVLTDNFVHVDLNAPELAPARLVEVRIDSIDGERTCGSLR
jgi:threonylcarbamoyladenosine tRNA methylthiotransferase MtaB